MVATHIADTIKKKHKKTVPDKIIKRYLSVYINSVIENPSFSSQTKEKLITTPSKFGSKPEFNKKFLKDKFDFKFINLKNLLSLFLIIVGILLLPILIIKIDEYPNIKNIISWNYFVLVQLYFLISYFSLRVR